MTIILREVKQDDNHKTDGGTVYKQILVNERLQIGKRCQKRELTWRRQLSRQRSAIESSAI
jgi:hypothetical protein